MLVQNDDIHTSDLINMHSKYIKNDNFENKSPKIKNKVKVIVKSEDSLFDREDMNNVKNSGQTFRLGADIIQGSPGALDGYGIKTRDLPIEFDWEQSLLNKTS